MKDLFRDLLQYGHHYDQKLADLFIAETAKVPGNSLKLFSHILNAQSIWNNRVIPQQQPYGMWDIHPVENLKDIDKANHEHSLLILDQFDANDIISYTNMKGQPYSNSVRDILFHVINHGTYHRAQIATDLKLHGLEPLITDYIFYKWQKQ